MSAAPEYPAEAVWLLRVPDGGRLLTANSHLFGAKGPLFLHACIDERHAHEAARRLSQQYGIAATPARFVVAPPETETQTAPAL